MLTHFSARLYTLLHTAHKLHTHLHTHTLLYKHPHASTHITQAPHKHTYTHILVYKHPHTHTHTHTYTFTHTHLHAFCTLPYTCLPNSPIYIEKNRAPLQRLCLVSIEIPDTVLCSSGLSTETSHLYRGTNVSVVPLQKQYVGLCRIRGFAKQQCLCRERVDCDRPKP